LFQPGLFLDYLAAPYQTAKHIEPLDTFLNFENGKAIVLDGHEGVTITLTTAADAATVIAKAIGYDKEWPEISGIQGNRVTFSEIISLGEKVRGNYYPQHTPDVDARSS
jgi:hypothetical protein